MSLASNSALDAFRDQVRHWCAANVPKDWRAAQTNVDDATFVRFQRDWFARLVEAGWAVPHWPQRWGGGLSTAEQVVLFRELAAADAPRLVLAFVGIHHAAATLLQAGTPEQQSRHLPAIRDGEIWCQAFSEPEAGSDLAALRTTARRQGNEYIVNGQKIWASGAHHAQWCLLLARTDPCAPKRKGISYFLVDLATPGIEIRPIRQATGASHFCEIFFDDVAVPVANRVGAENDGWSVAQATLGAERGMTMLELAERLWFGGFERFRVECSQPRGDGTRAIDDPICVDLLARTEIELTALRRMCRDLVDRHESGSVGPADASIVKLVYSEVLQRFMDHATQVMGFSTLGLTTAPRSAGWESGAWAFDFIGSWEWTIPGGTSEIQRSIIAQRGLGLPRDAR